MSEVMMNPWRNISSMVNGQFWDTRAPASRVEHNKTDKQYVISAGSTRANERNYIDTQVGMMMPNKWLLEIKVVTPQFDDIPYYDNDGLPAGDVSPGLTGASLGLSAPMPFISYINEDKERT